jgi:hypothetical protein
MASTKVINWQPRGTREYALFFCTIKLSLGTVTDFFETGMLLSAIFFVAVTPSSVSHHILVLYTGQLWLNPLCIIRIL